MMGADPNQQGGVSTPSAVSLVKDNRHLVQENLDLVQQNLDTVKENLGQVEENGCLVKENLCLAKEVHCLAKITDALGIVVSELWLREQIARNEITNLNFKLEQAWLTEQHL
jgi:hypothetical protein